MRPAIRHAAGQDQRGITRPVIGFHQRDGDGGAA
jgi:hypothetical protein